MGKGYLLKKETKIISKPINKSSFMKTVKDNIKGAAETVKNYSYVAGLKGRQDKMITNWAMKKPSTIPTDKRSQGAAIAEKKNIENEMKKKLKAKGIYK